MAHISLYNERAVKSLTQGQGKSTAHKEELARQYFLVDQPKALVSQRCEIVEATIDDRFEIREESLGPNQSRTVPSLNVSVP